MHLQWPSEWLRVVFFLSHYFDAFIKGKSLLAWMTFSKAYFQCQGYFFSFTMKRCDKIKCFWFRTVRMEERTASCFGKNIEMLIYTEHCEMT